MRYEKAYTPKQKIFDRLTEPCLELLHHTVFMCEAMKVSCMKIPNKKAERIIKLQMAEHKKCIKSCL